MRTLLGATALAAILPTVGMAQSPSFLVDLDDPRAPGGATIGAKLSDADAALTGAGYQKTRPCTYLKQVGAETAHVALFSGAQCTPDSPLSDIRYSVARRDGPPAELVQHISRKLGKEGNCRLGGADPHCGWSNPSGTPLIKHIELRLVSSSLVLKLTGIDDLRRKASSRPADTGRTQSTTKSATDPPGSSTEKAGTSKEGRFEVEGVQLGMTVAQVTAALRANGFVPADGGKGGHFVNDGGKPHTPGRTNILVSYLPAMGRYPVAQMEDLIFSYPRSSKDRELKKHPLYEKLAATYGDPDECTTPHSCKWLRRADGWGETLEIQFSHKTNIELKAINVDRARFSLLASTTPAPSGPAPQSAPAPAKASTEPSSLDFEAMAPYGVRVGMPYSDVESVIKAAGFRGGTGACIWYRDGGSRNEKISIQIAGQRGPCGGGALVERMEFLFADSRGLGAPAESLIASMNKQLGADAQCKEHKQLNRFECKWQAPPNAPFAREVAVSFSPGRINYRALARQGLASPLRR